MQGKNIPEVAADLYARAEKFRVQRGNLEIIKNRYNEMLATMLDVEKPLLKSQMKAIDKLLEKGLKELSRSSTPNPDPNPDPDPITLTLTLTLTLTP